ncbi:MAG: phosphatase PAP2 family protein [Oscillospiraceae bacterium]|nr:phosphatase PAP2 family protein [Oscillospiraceae bacterium]
MNRNFPTKRQWIMMLYLPFHLLWYFILELSITTNYYPIHCALDDLIPFCEWFIFPYFSWFLYMVAAGLWFLIKDSEAFEHYMLSLIFGFFICTLICSVFPNGQDLRPDGYRANFAAQIVRLTQAFDTNTNVFPSMHVVGAFGACFAIAKSATLRKKVWLQICNWTLCTAIILATVFLKQHSVLDIVSGVVVSVAVYFFVYRGYAGRVLTHVENLFTKPENKPSE